MRSVDRESYSYRRDPAVPRFPDDRPIIILDGDCALCSGWAQFLLRHDRAARYRLLFGPITVALALVVAGGRLVLVPCGWAFLGLPMPLRWTPGGNASEYAKDDRFWFDVELGIR
jgi:hypothetical protein